MGIKSPGKNDIGNRLMGKSSLSMEWPGLNRKEKL